MKRVALPFLLVTSVAPVAGAQAQQEPPPIGTATPQAPAAPAPPPAATPEPEAAPTTAPPAAAPDAAPAPTAPPAVLPAPGVSASDAPQAAATKEKAEPKAPARRFLGLAVGSPDTGSLPGRFKPAYGAASRGVSDYRFDFHGYLNVPFRAGLNERKNPSEYQYEQVVHGAPLVPDDYERFEHTGVVPQPWVQLAFAYGNSHAVATVIVAARSVSNATGFFDPPTQVGINDAWITFTPGFKAFDLQVDVGGFSERYGGMGEYDLGRYDTPVIVRLGGVGETARFRYRVAPKLTFLAEHGIMGQLEKAPLGVEPAGWNSFADPNVASSFANHAHLGLALADVGRLGLHYIGAFARDDRTSPGTRDGSLTIFGADAAAQCPPAGRLYVAAAHTVADDAASISGVVRVLNTFGGAGLTREYLGPASNGNGSLTTAGAQYDVSIGELIRSPQPFSGYGPDVFASAFAMYAGVGSDDPAFDDKHKLKYGAEVTYSMLPWLALSTRYDRVIADLDADEKTYAVVSPRVILRTDYNSQDQLTLQYSRWFYGSGVNVRTGYPPREDPAYSPDEDTFSLTANMWW